MIKPDPDKVLAALNRLSENTVEINSILTEINNDIPILFPSFSGPQRYQTEMEKAMAEMKHAAMVFDEISKTGINTIEAYKNIE